MSTTRATTARHVRQRKLNTKQALRIIRESDIEDAPDDESQRHIPQVETGVEKGEEIEYHLQAVIHAAALGSKGAAAQSQSYIPTPDAVKAQDVKYDELYPTVFKEPNSYIRFSSTVEDSVGVQYCINDDDAEFLAKKLNAGKDAQGQPRKENKSGQCSEDVFEEVMDFFEETSARIQPFATVVDNAPVLSLEEMERSLLDNDAGVGAGGAGRSLDSRNVSAEAQKWMKHIYPYWVERKGNRPIMPSIKVRVLDTSSDADDADPYVCFRRREVRQTRKTRGRDAQVVEKLKKLRLELEQARALVQLVAQREQTNKENLEVTREVFAQRKMLKQVKAQHHIIGEKGDDEELLVNQKPVTKVKGRQDSAQRPPTIRIRSDSQRVPDNDLIQLSDIQAEAEAQVRHTIESRKEQHKRWNDAWVDDTWRPITPPLDSPEDPPKWAPLFAAGDLYPTPPPTLPSEGSHQDEDVEMLDSKPSNSQSSSKRHRTAEEPDFVFHIPGAYPVEEDEDDDEGEDYYAKDRSRKSGMILMPPLSRNPTPACRLRYGRGGRCHLEAKRRKLNNCSISGVVSETDSDIDDDDDDGGEVEDFFVVDPQKIFDYRSAIHSHLRPDHRVIAGNVGGGGYGGGGEQQQHRRHHSSTGDASALIAQAQAAANNQAQAQQQASAGASAGSS